MFLRATASDPTSARTLRITHDQLRARLRAIFPREQPPPPNGNDDNNVNGTTQTMLTTQGVSKREIERESDSARRGRKRGE